MLMETKIDAPLRAKLAAEDQNAQDLLQILGKCTAPIDGEMRQRLIDSGADVVTMASEVFTARVRVGDIRTVAALEFVVQLQLSQTTKPLSR